MTENSAALSTNEILLAILALLVDSREQILADKSDQVKTELILANAGLSYGTIARLLGKKPDAVRMMISRARASEARTPEKRSKPKESAEDNLNA
jgi:DNA-directed RNA polymerase specialized sigma24 family protein